MTPKRKTPPTDGLSVTEQPAKKTATERVAGEGDGQSPQAESLAQEQTNTQRKAQTGKKRGRPPKATEGGWTINKTLPANKEVALKWNTANERSQDRHDFEDSLFQPIETIQEWSLADEESFQEISEQLPVRADHPQDGQMVKLWKDCYRFHECTPFDLLPPEKDIQYGGEGELWSENFCELMRKLMFFPPFMNDKALMVVVFTYAVICRTKDSRLWFPLLDDEIYGWFATHWRRLISGHPLVQEKSPWVTHRLAREKLMTTHAQRYSVPTILFDKLEELCEVDENSQAIQIRGPYSVTEEDLSNVLKVMTSVGAHGGVPLYLDHSVYGDYARLSRATRDGLGGQPESQFINKYANAVVPDIRRRAAIRRKWLECKWIDRPDLASCPIIAKPSSNQADVQAESVTETDLVIKSITAAASPAQSPQ